MHGGSWGHRGTPLETKGSILSPYSQALSCLPPKPPHHPGLRRASENSRSIPLLQQEARRERFGAAVASQVELKHKDTVVATSFSLCRAKVVKLTRRHGPRVLQAAWEMGHEAEHQ